jgi:hypothetical protein
MKSKYPFVIIQCILKWTIATVVLSAPSLPCYGSSTGHLVEDNLQKDYIFEKLERLIEREKRDTEKVNVFFAYRLEHEDCIFWREGRMLLHTTLDPFLDKDLPVDKVWDMRILGSTNPTFVDDESEMGSDDPNVTTFLIRKATVRKMVFDCVCYGEMIVIKRTVAYGKISYHVEVYASSKSR